jgi:hypothetical protein
MLKLFSKHPETAKVLFDIIIYGDEGEGNGISTVNKTTKRLRNPGQKSISRDGQKEII